MTESVFQVGDAVVYRSISRRVKAVVLAVRPRRAGHEWCVIRGAAIDHEPALYLLQAVGWWGGVAYPRGLVFEAPADWLSRRDRARPPGPRYPRTPR